MEYRKKLNQIKVVLGLEVKLASEKLIDGVTIVEAENFEPGFPLFVVNEDGSKTPAPAGIHETESGVKVEVDEQGKIVKVEAKEAEAEAPKVEVEVEAAAEEDMVPATETPAEEAEGQRAINEVMKKVVMAMEDIAKDVAEIKTEMASIKAKYEKFSKEPGAAKAPKVTRGEFAATDDSVLEARIAALNELKASNFFAK